MVTDSSPFASSLLIFALVLGCVPGTWCPAEGAVHKEHPQSWHSAEDSVVSLQSESAFVLNLELYCEFCFVPWVWLGQSHSLKFSQIMLSSSILSVLLENEWEELEESKPEASWEVELCGRETIWIFVVVVMQLKSNVYKSSSRTGTWYCLNSPDTFIRLSSTDPSELRSFKSCKWIKTTLLR